MTPLHLSRAAILACVVSLAAGPAAALGGSRTLACADASWAPAQPCQEHLRPGVGPTLLGADLTVVGGPFPDPFPVGGAKVLQARAESVARLGYLHIDDLSAGSRNGNSPYFNAGATSLASFSDILTFRAPAGMSTADFRASVADLHFAFGASVAPFNSIARLTAYTSQGNFYPSTDYRSGRPVYLATDNGESVTNPADRVLHLSLDDGSNNRFVSFALTVELSGEAHYSVASSEAVAWLSDISFSRAAARTAGLSAMASAVLPAGISVTSASGELVLDPVTGQFGYLAAAAAVPEPVSFALLGAGLALLAWRARGAGASA